MRQLELGRPGMDQEHYGEVQEMLEGGQRLVHVVHGFEQLCGVLGVRRGGTCPLGWRAWRAATCIGGRT